VKFRLNNELVKKVFRRDYCLWCLKGAKLSDKILTQELNITPHPELLLNPLLLPFEHPCLPPEACGDFLELL